MNRVAALALAVGLLTATPALAAEPAPVPTWLAAATPAPTVGRPQAPRLTWRSLVGLGAIGALGAAAYFIKRRRRVQAGGTDEPQLRVVEAVRVGPKGQIVLTNVRGRMLLLGVTDTSIQRIAWVGNAPAPKRERAVSAAPDPVSESDVPTIAPPPSRMGDKQPLRLAVSSQRAPFQAVLDALRTAAPVVEDSRGAVERFRAAPPYAEHHRGAVDPIVEAAASTRDVVERAATRGVPMTVTTLRSIDPILEGQVTGLKTKRPSKRKL